MDKDLFICHAREDKSAVVHPLIFALEKAGISYWLDEEEIKWGESVTAKVNEGLKTSKYVVVILSRAFLSKNWPRRELWAVLNIEAQTGDVKVLPILVGSDADIQYFRSEFPLLNDKLYLIWDGSPQPIVRRFIDLIQGYSTLAREREELLTCGLCSTPFERGIHVCLGCKGSIVYGLTQHERIEKRKWGAMSAGAILIIFFFFVPGFLRNTFSIPASDMWGVPSTLSNLLKLTTSNTEWVRMPALAALTINILGFAILGIFGAIVSIIAGSALENHAVKKGLHLIRTFRP